VAVHGGELLIASGKGEGTGPNAAWQDAPDRPGKHRHPYIATMIRGSIARVSLVEVERNRDRLTQAVVRSNQMEGRTGEISFQHGENPIHHVIYVIKENRTYDQLFGDIREANGDSSLVMYGEDIAPNQHKLARQFGILDNFYDSGEVSGNGHVWSTAAISSDYTEKTWEITYRGKERHYDYEGYVGDSNPMTIGIPDVNEPGTGYLWGNLARHNLTYRNYGEYVNTWWCEDLAQNSPAATGAASGRPPDCTRKAVDPGEDLPEKLGGGKSLYQYKIPTSFAPTNFCVSLGLSCTLAKLARVSSCPTSCCCACRTITPPAPVPDRPRRTLLSPTTTWRWGAWWKPFSAAPIGMTRRSSSSRMMRKTAPITWTRIAASP
jgi:hypothetical protein